MPLCLQMLGSLSHGNMKVATDNMCTSTVQAYKIKEADNPDQAMDLCGSKHLAWVL